MGNLELLLLKRCLHSFKHLDDFKIGLKEGRWCFGKFDHAVRTLDAHPYCQSLSFLQSKAKQAESMSAWQPLRQIHFHIESLPTHLALRSRGDSLLIARILLVRKP
jgi:hypothetical protein